MKNKKGKKLVVLGAMAALLTLIGVSGSQTYAKYIESAEVKTNVATVAKWGFVQNLQAENLFGTKYENDGSSPLSTVKDDASSTKMTICKVDSAGDIVAPGSTGSMSYKIDGKAEVDYQISFAVNDANVYDILLDDGVAEHDDYMPLLWTVQLDVDATSYDAPFSKGTTGSLLEVLNYLKTYCTQTIQAGDTVDLDLTLSWKWAFEGNTRYTSEDAKKLTYEGEKLSSDDADTILGILAGENTSSNIQYEYSKVLAGFKTGKKTSLQVGFNDFNVTIKQTQNA